jgi:PAS domain S-box-containing protein
MVDFASIFSNTPDAYLVSSVDATHSVTAVNDAYVNRAGLAGAKIIGRPLLEIVSETPALGGPRAVPLYQSSLKALLGGHDPSRVELPIAVSESEASLADANSRPWAEITLTSIKDEHGQKICVLHRLELTQRIADEPGLTQSQYTQVVRQLRAREVNAHDALRQTRKQLAASRQELRGSEARYRLLIESLRDYAVIMLDDFGVVTSWNIGAERLLGYTAEEILDRSSRVFFTPEDQARGEFEREIRTALQTGRSDDDRWHLRKDGTRFFVTGMMIDLKDDEDRHIGLAKIMRDITDRKLANAERERLLENERSARAEAERTGRLKDDFLATLSHELRTPLNAILGWTQVLKETGQDPEELAQGLEVIDRNTRLQAALIEELLDMNRIVSGKVRLTIEPVDLVKLARAAVESMSTATATKKIRLYYSAETNAVEIPGDHDRLHQVLLNLLSNALRFTPENGEIEISVEMLPDSAALTVRDTGSGIRPEFLPHVFERFRQADASTTRRHGGLGLGLAIVRQLVELHGGTVAASSAGEGRGSVFRVSLPRQRSVALTPPPGTARPQGNAYRGRADLRGIKVLVVDDEPDSASLVKRVLEDCHADVQSATSMEEALRKFTAYHPDVLLSDIGMPEHDGYELIRRVRELPGGEGVPAAALSALARAEDVDRALHAGFQTHVAKPLEPSALVLVVEKLASHGFESSSPPSV